jgi:Ca-activated chloride channel family protein
VPVSTVSFGTQEGTIDFDGDTVPVPANNGALQAVADATGGTFSEAASAAELETILATVGSDLGTETEQREIWEWFLAGGIVALTMAAATSLLWFQRLP